MTTSQMTAVLVIDMLNEYLMPEGKLYCARCREIIDGLREFLGSARGRGWPIFYLNTQISSDTEPLAQRWGTHAQPGSRGALVVSELTPATGELVISKRGYDGFLETRLHQELSSHLVTRLIITGIHTHVCVLFTAATAFQLGYEVVVPRDLVAASTPEHHVSRLAFIETHLGRVASSVELLAG